MSDYLENKFLNAYFRNQASGIPATVYAALFTAVSNADAGTGTEVAGFAYARTAITFGAASGGSMSNSVAVTFPAASGGNWGTIPHMSIFDASTSGNAMIAITAMGSSVIINDGDTFRFPIGSIVIQAD